MSKARKPKYLKHNEVCLDKEECPHSPDLLLLRDAAVDERNAIQQYLNSARANCLPELFLDVAEDEMQHYMETMNLITRLDPVQAEAFREVNLDMMVMGRPAKTNNKKWSYMHNNVDEDEDEEEDVMVLLPSERDMPLICHLTAALTGELHAINKYQRYMLETCDPRVKAHFCDLMNDEKEHVAEFTAALFDITGEPLQSEPE